MNKPIYYIENRGWFFIYHFIVFMIGGLRFIEEKEPIIYIPYMKEFLLDIDRRALIGLSQRDDKDHSGPKKDGGSNFSYSVGGINYEIMNFLKNKYRFIDSIAALQNSDSLQFIYNPGEPVTLHSLGTNVHQDVFPFLRTLFLSEVQEKGTIPGKYIYITRRNSENVSGHFGVKRRQVMNEEDMVKMLDKYKFQYVNLETLSLLEKIELFQTAQIILSPNSGGLTFSFLANKDSLIIELMPLFEIGQYNQEWKQEQFKEMCEAVGVPYFRFDKMLCVENELNMYVDIEKLDMYLDTVVNMQC